MQENRIKNHPKNQSLALLLAMGIAAVSIHHCSLLGAEPLPEDPNIAQGTLQSVFEGICETFETAYPFTPSERDRWDHLKLDLEEDLSNSIHTPATFTIRVNQTFDQLGISHLKLFGDATIRDHDIRATGKAHTGIHMTWIDGKWYVDSVSDSASSKMPELKTGFEITHINKVALPADPEAYPMGWILQAQQAHFGPLGAEFEIQGRDLNEQPYACSGVFSEWKGSWSKGFGNMGSLPIGIDAYLEQGVQVIAFNYFVFDLLPTIRTALENTPENTGLILDLRGNPGGMGIMANAIAGKLTDTPFKLGDMQLKGGWMAFFADPQPKAYLGKIAILIDEFSASTSEIFAQGMKEAKRAKIFGRPSMGAALPSKFVQISDTLTLQLPVAKFVSQDGYVIEGNGVIPDKTIAVDREDLINHKDPVMKEAVDWILKANK